MLNYFQVSSGSGNRQPAAGSQRPAAQGPQPVASSWSTALKQPAVASPAANPFRVGSWQPQPAFVAQAQVIAADQALTCWNGFLKNMLWNQIEIIRSGRGGCNNAFILKYQ